MVSSTESEIEIIVKNAEGDPDTTATIIHQNNIDYEPKVSVIIPVYNALEDLKLLLKSVSNNFNFKLGDVTLINDCSDIDTSSFLEEYTAKDKRFKLLNNETNLGFVKTCNRGMREAKGEIIVLLNSDTKIPKEFCERIIKCFESDEKIGVASPISSHTCDFFIPLPKQFSLEKMNKLLRKKHKCQYPLISAAEGFCFCIRKEVIKQQGYFDEVWGKGYHEEVDFAYRAITYGWKNVLIDDLYVYHKRQASFGADRREQLIKQNTPEFDKRWSGFRAKYIKNNNLINPIDNIIKELFWDKNINYRNNYEHIFSIKNSVDKKYKFITLFGCKIRVERKSSDFPKQAKKIKKIYKKASNVLYVNKRAVIFAGFNSQSVISNNVVDYLTELKRHSDYIVFVCDNPLIPSELKKINKIVDAVIFEKHGEYDFGSYKRGYLLLEKLGILDSVEQLLFCNDSVEFLGKSLSEVFKKSFNHDFYGLTQHAYGYGFDNKTNDYTWVKSPHIQSYFFSLSKNVFTQFFFKQFINSIKEEKNKKDIIINYEMGLSKILVNQGFKLNSFYPPSNEDVDIMEYYLKKESKFEGERIFLKLKFRKSPFNAKNYKVEDNVKEKTPFMNFLKIMFSIKNEPIRKKHKIVTVAGLKLKVKRKHVTGYSLLEKMFSVKNEPIRKQHKVITILGFKLKFKSKRLIITKENIDLKDRNDILSKKISEKEKETLLFKETSYYSDRFKYVLPIDTIKNIIKNPNIKVVSFDIFDTLLYRPCINPTDIFYLVAKQVDNQYNVDFIKLRLNAETLLNQKNANIHDIYNFIQKHYNLDEELIKNLKKAEIVAEKRLLQVRDDIKEIYDFAIKNNKKVIAISDMYLPSEILNDFLCEKGYKNISKIYVSNEYQSRKDDGLLYDVVINEQKFESDEICHIGDNFISDYKIALKKHITAIYYPSIKNIIFSENSIYSDAFGNNISNDPLTRILIAHSLFRVFKYPNDSLKTPKLFSNLLNFVDMVFAPILFYIAMTIATNKDIQENYDKVHFAARDGYLPQVVYDLVANHLSNCIPSEYIYASRRAYLAGMYNNFEDWFDDNAERMQPNLTLNNLLNIIDDVNLKNMIKTSLSDEELKLFVKNNKVQTKEILKKIYPLYKDYYEQKKEQCLKYYSQKINNSTDKNIVFDVGHSGSISVALNKITNKIWDKIYLWQSDKNITRDKLNNTKTITLFDNNYKQCSIMLLFEELFAPIEGSCIGFSSDLKPICEDMEFSQEMQKDMAMIKETCSLYIDDIFKVFGDYTQFLSLINVNDILKVIIFMIKQSPYNETEIFKNIIYPDPTVRKYPVTLESKLSNQCYSINVFNQTAFNNPVYSQKPKINKVITNKKIGIHLHLYNIHLINEILTYLKDFPFAFDLIITLSDEKSINLLGNLLNKNTIKNLQNIEFITVPNRGRDVAPWLVSTKEHQKKYDLFCHVHSKESSHFKEMGNSWRQYLYDNLLSSETVKNIINIVENNPQIGIVIPKFYEQLKSFCIRRNIPVEGKDNEIEIINKLITQMRFERTFCYNNLIFSAGTMFWYVPKSLKDLFDLNLSYEDFPEEPIPNGGTLAHAIERLPVYVCQENGYKCQIYNHL